MSLNDLKVVDLKKLCKAQGLSSTECNVRKAELVSLLEELGVSMDNLPQKPKKKPKKQPKKKSKQKFLRSKTDKPVIAFIDEIQPEIYGKTIEFKTVKDLYDFSEVMSRLLEETIVEVDGKPLKRNTLRCGDLIMPPDDRYFGIVSNSGNIVYVEYYEIPKEITECIEDPKSFYSEANGVFSADAFIFKD